MSKSVILYIPVEPITPSITLFYSWQSDKSPKFNRNFIEDAIKRAAKEIKRKDGVDVYIDQATRDLPGSPDIPEAIFSKIDRAQIFIGDITNVTYIGEANEVNTQITEEDNLTVNSNSTMSLRPSPNPNVLIELGYALKALGEERIVMVCNTSNGRVEDVPFDIRHRRVLSYQLNEITTTRSDERNNLVSAITMAISVILDSMRNNINSAKEVYLRRLEVENEFISKNAQDPSLSLENRLRIKDVYVSLSLKRKKINSDHDSQMRPAEAIEEYIKGRNFTYSGLRTEEPLLSFEDTLQFSPCLVIRGAPGSGKSTLLRYTAFKHAEALLRNRNDVQGVPRFPIYLRISKYAEEGLQTKKSLTDFLFEHFAQQELPKEELEALILDELRRGTCLVLLDGLDEVTSDRSRKDVVRQIQYFVDRHLPAGNRFIVTSRIVGYEEAPIGGDFVVYDIQDMSLSQIKDFTNLHISAVSQMQEVNLSNTGAGVNWAFAMIDKDLERISFYRLAVNPLLLRIALQFRGISVPKSRVELYATASKMLTSTWRDSQGVMLPDLLDQDIIESLLGELAYWMHTNKPTGIISEQEFFVVLGKEWLKWQGSEGTVGQPNPLVIREIKQFLTAIRRHSGIFVEVGVRQYAFVHLSFQEYFAAVKLTREKTSLISEIHSHLHHSRWQEVIVFAIALSTQENSLPAINVIFEEILFNYNSGNSDGSVHQIFTSILRKDFLFLLRCIEEQVLIPLQVTETVAVRIVEELVYQRSAVAFKRYREELEQSVKQLSSTTIGGLIRKGLLTHIRSEEESIISRALYYLSEYFEIPEEHYEEIIQLLTHRSIFIRIDAIDCLGSILRRNADITIVRALFSLMKDELYGHFAALNLLPIMNLSEDDYDTLISEQEEQLDDETPDLWDNVCLGLLHRNSSIRRRFINTINNSDYHTIGVEFRLAHYIQNSTYRDDRAFSVQAIEGLKNTSPYGWNAVAQHISVQDMWELDNVIACLLHKIEEFPDGLQLVLNLLSDSDPKRRSAAVKGLEQLKFIPVQVKPILQVSASDSNSKVREIAVRLLGKHFFLYPEVASIITSRINDEESRVCIEAIRASAIHAQNDQNTVDVLLKKLSDPNLNVGCACAEELGRLQAKRDLIIEELFSLFVSTEDLKLKTSTAIGLVRASYLDDQVIDALCNALLNESSLPYTLQSTVAQVLGDAEHNVDLIIESLLMGLQHSIEEVREYSHRSLTKLGGRVNIFSEIIVRRLYNMITDKGVQEKDKENYYPLKIRDRIFDLLWIAGEQAY